MTLSWFLESQLNPVPSLRIISTVTFFSMSQWDPSSLTTESSFVMGTRANKALGLGATRGRIYMKHPELFKVSFLSFPNSVRERCCTVRAHPRVNDAHLHNFSQWLLLVIHIEKYTLHFSKLFKF